MDKQDLRNLFDAVRRRLDRRPPRPGLVYGRREAPAAGFSLSELADAGLDEDSARRLGLPVDPARLTSLGSNVCRLREFIRVLSDVC